uniref:Uncharacterized protein n=1 Tax=Cacopsylla melanoneura TaxID=428564 RepID=A0A8D8YK70_9HEMI
MTDVKTNELVLNRKNRFYFVLNPYCFRDTGGRKWTARLTLSWPSMSTDLDETKFLGKSSFWTEMNRFYFVLSPYRFRDTGGRKWTASLTLSWPFMLTDLDETKFFGKSSF